MFTFKSLNKNWLFYEAFKRGLSKKIFAPQQTTNDNNTTRRRNRRRSPIATAAAQATQHHPLAQPLTTSTPQTSAADNCTKSRSCSRVQQGKAGRAGGGGGGGGSG